MLTHLLLILAPIARMAELVDAADLKSVSRKRVGVQVPLWAPTATCELYELKASCL